MQIVDQIQDIFPERDIFHSKGDFERRAFPHGTYYTFPKFVTRSLMLLKARGSNRHSGKSGRNCGKEPPESFAFPLNHKWLHQPTCHLRLRHLAFPNQSLIVTKPAEMRRFFAFRRPRSSLYVPTHPAQRVGLDVGLKGTSNGQADSDGGQESG